jgi:hypothetical protein
MTHKEAMVSNDGGRAFCFVCHTGFSGNYCRLCVTGRNKSEMVCRKCGRAHNYEEWVAIPTKKGR